jgi:hypothetical protein
MRRIDENDRMDTAGAVGDARELREHVRGATRHTAWHGVAAGAMCSVEVVGPADAETSWLSWSTPSPWRTGTLRNPEARLGHEVAHCSRGRGDAEFAHFRMPAQAWGRG